MTRKELEEQMKAVLMPVAPDDWLIERCCNVAELYAHQQNGAKPNVIGSRAIVHSEVKLEICSSEKEKCKGG